MPYDPDATITISALDNAPRLAHGLVRDLRVRWALEEIGQPYRTQLLDAMVSKPDAYREWQPFNQVPAFDDGTVRLFESGAILLHIGEQDERLLPREPQARADVMSWLIAALNSVEPMLMQLIWLDFFEAGKPWTIEARPSAVGLVTMRLDPLENVLAGKEWLAGAFSIADIMMVTVLRELNHTDILNKYPEISAYKMRGEAREPFQQALADQLADLGEPAPLGEPG